jgi:uncharacterized protein (TIGR02597 family)
MKTTALRFRTLALGLAMSGSIAAPLEAIDAFTDPVGYYTLSLVGGADNVVALPMVRDAVFNGVVDNGATPFTENSFDALAGTAAPGWTANQWAYAAGTQPQTYYVEFTTGALKGLYYKITANGTGSITLDTETDSLLNHPLPGNLVAALADGDSFKIRPYWRIRDVFESNGSPIIESRAGVIAKDDILIPNYSAVGINKGASTIIFHTTQVGGLPNGPGWRADGQGATDFADFILRPNECMIVRRRNAGNLNLTSLGGVLMNRTISFVPGGNGTSQNDIFVSINRPAAVTLNDSGLRIADQSMSLIKDSTSDVLRQDELYVFNPPTGYNQGATNIYYYRAGWRKVGGDGSDVGATVFLEPGKGYIVRKRATNGGVDWVNDANY